MTLKKLDHLFKNPQLSYDSQPNTQPYIRLSFYFRKLPEVSDEQFHRHWETVHADLTVASKAFKDCHIGRYVQVGEICSIQVHLRFLMCDVIVSPDPRVERESTSNEITSV